MSAETKARTYIVSFEDYWNENNSRGKQKAKEDVDERKKVEPYRIVKMPSKRKDETFQKEPQVEDAPKTPREISQVSSIEKANLTKEEVKIFLNNLNLIKNKSISFGNTNADYLHSRVDDSERGLDLVLNYRKNVFIEKQILFGYLVYENKIDLTLLFFESDILSQEERNLAFLEAALDSDVIIDNFSKLEKEREKLFLPADSFDGKNLLPEIIRNTTVVPDGLTDRFIDFYWGSEEPKTKNNDFLLMKILFENFGEKDFYKKFPNKSSMKKYMTEKYISSALKKAFDEFKIKADSFWYNKSISEKKKILFKDWYKPGKKSEETVDGREIYIEPEIDKLKPADFLNGVFGLTSWGEIVYIDIFEEFCFGYQMKESEVVEKSSKNYLNFLVIAGSVTGEDFIIKNMVFQPGSYSYGADTKPEEKFMSLEERFPRVHLAESTEDDRIEIGYERYWLEKETAYANYDEIFKNCIGSNFLDDKKIDNIKICLPCLNLEKTFPVFTLFEKMSKENFKELSGFEEKCITRDLVAIDDIVALFEFDSAELGGAESGAEFARKETQQLKIIFGV